MAYTDGTAPWARRASFGTLQYKNIYNTSFGYTYSHKKIAAGTNTAVLAAQNGSLSAQTITAGITNPDVPRGLIVVVGGTAAHVADGRVIVTGVNSEGKTLTESFRTSNNTTGTLTGKQAFARVTSVYIDPMLGTGATISVGTQNALGIRHRLFPFNTTVKVYTKTTTAYGTLTLQGAPTVVADNTYLELNLVTPANAPDATKSFLIAYTYDNWSDGTSIKDQPEYLFTTSTSSTSSSTSSTTVTTSTSSTSISTSSTSSSTSSTSTSTSSTSTSTTTTP